MAPVIRALRAEDWVDCRVLITAQHRELVDEMLAFFDLVADVDLDVMRPDQSLAQLTSRLIVGLDESLATIAPDVVLAQGDTTTVLATALAAFYRRIPFGHVEAGLRTDDFAAPFPEEANRVLSDRLAALHFAPTAGASENLRRDGIAENTIHVTGNTVIDALQETVRRKIPIGVDLDPKKRMILVTAHRRESFGAPLRQICQAVRALAARYDDVEFLWPLHPNPAVRGVVREIVGPLESVRFCEPLAYGPFTSAMSRSYLILTDSGGIQEEAPTLGKPVLVLRDTSERPEAIRAGVSKLVGTDEATIVREASRLLDEPAAYQSMSVGANPFGDGAAAGRIVEITKRFLTSGSSAARSIRE